MARVVMIKVGDKNGTPLYQPLDSNDVKVLDGRQVIACDVVGDKSTRTSLQNASIHKYCELLATALNDAGYDMRRTMKQDVDIPWSPATVKEHLWRVMQIAMLGKESTTKLETGEVSMVYETLSRHLATTRGINVPFPSIYRGLDDNTQ